MDYIIREMRSEEYCLCCCDLLQRKSFGHLRECILHKHADVLQQKIQALVRYRVAQDVFRP